LASSVHRASARCNPQQHGRFARSNPLTMNVYFMCTYYSQWAHNNLAPRTQDQWCSFKFCRAVKNKGINGTLTVPLATGHEVINATNVARARWIFGLFIKHKLNDLSLPSPVLIPVPSKDGLIGADTFRSLEMVHEATSPHGTWPIATVIRFSERLTPAYAGGLRGREALKPYLRVVAAPPPGSIILVDDIVTTGGSLLACYDVLAEVGRAPFAAIVCGNTVSDSLLSAFGNHYKTIDTTLQLVNC
jgi:hypothetical protein